MSKKKDPPNYPGDEAVNKKIGEILHSLRLQKGLSIEEVNAFADQQDSRPFLARALALVVRQLRETRKMSRAQLSDTSGLPLALINRIERAKAPEITLTQVIRLAMALEHSASDFIEQVDTVEERLLSE
jgi:transcriptional regulator with XRE-family HTH domain